MKKIILITIFIFSSSLLFAGRVTPIVEAIRKVDKSVVNIRTEKTVRRNINPFFNDPFFDDFFGFDRVYKTQSLGSGFIYKENGIVITNYHVIEGATDISVIMSDGTQYKAKLLGSDKKLDIAVLKIISDKKFPFVKLGNSDDIILGESVIAIGNPYGLNNSVTTGVISNKLRVIKSGNSFSVYIQSDALINPGHSGGPLINVEGKVIGINSAIYKQAQGIGFSIPINILKRVEKFLESNRYIPKGNIGFNVKETRYGLLIKKIDTHSDAYKQGLRNNDKIFSVANIPVGTSVAFNDILYSYPPNTKIRIKIKNNDFKTYKIKVGNFPKNYGLKILESKFGLKLVEKKDYISVVSTNIPAYIQKKDIIIAINNKEINSIGELNDILVNNMGSDIVVTVFRNNGLYQVQLGL
jgi:serine protease Do